MNCKRLLKPIILTFISLSIIGCTYKSPFIPTNQKTSLTKNKQILKFDHRTDLTHPILNPYLPKPQNQMKWLYRYQAWKNNVKTTDSLITIKIISTNNKLLYIEFLENNTSDIFQEVEDKFWDTILFYLPLDYDNEFFTSKVYCPNIKCEEDIVVPGGRFKTISFLSSHLPNPSTWTPDMPLKKVTDTLTQININSSIGLIKVKERFVNLDFTEQISTLELIGFSTNE